MVKANELRIGNLLNYQTAEGDVVTATIDWQDIQWISEDPKGFNLVHSPIPLTEEWLVKLGFEQVNGSISYDRNKLSLYFGETILSGVNGRTYYNCCTIFEYTPKYVHKLQNLYFALTGEELEMKGGNNE